MSFSVKSHSAVKSTVKKMAIVFNCLKTGREFLQPSDLKREQTKRDTASHTPKKGKD